MAATTTLSTTTLTAAIGATDCCVPVASVANIVPGQFLFITGEAMQVLALTGTSNLIAKVQRGAMSTPAVGHASGATVYVANGDQLYTSDPVGVPASPALVSPWINTEKGTIWVVSGSSWIPTGGSGGAGDVIGPGSSTDSVIAVWDGTTGTLLKNSAVALTAAATIPITSGGTGAVSFKAAGIVAAANLKNAIVAGGAAGNRTVTGVAVGDQLVAVNRYIGAGVAVTDVSSLTSEFTISGANQINNTGGTNTTGDKLEVWWVKLT